jgi:hypothetical protein
MHITFYSQDLRPLEWLTRRWENNIKVNAKEIEYAIGGAAGGGQASAPLKVSKLKEGRNVPNINNIGPSTQCLAPSHIRRLAPSVTNILKMLKDKLVSTTFDRHLHL